MSVGFGGAMSDPFVGEIRMFAFGYVPKDWAACAGQVLPIEQNTELFSLIGDTYGGDGQSTFALPDLRGHVTTATGAALNLCIAMVGIWPPRD
jgi:microcystin-dependent protein